MQNTTQTANYNWVTHSPNNAPFTTQPCNLFYLVSLDQNQTPILGTMRAKPTQTYDKGNGPCTEAFLPPYQMVAPAGQKQCFFPNGNRYFYQISKITGQIVPNSMISVGGQGKPPMCVGTHVYLEFKHFSI